MARPHASFPRVVVVASALPFLGIGAAFLVAPEAMAARIDLALGSVTALGDVRALYGGLQLAIGGALLWAGLSRDWLRAGLTLQVATYGGLAFGRGLSLVADGAPGAFGLALWGGELVGLTLGVIAWRARAY